MKFQVSTGNLGQELVVGPLALMLIFDFLAITMGNSAVSSFNQPVTITLTATGISYITGSPCPTLPIVSSIPIISNIFALGAYLGSEAGSIIQYIFSGGSTQIPPNSACLSVASSLVTFNYDPGSADNLIYSFFAVIIVVVCAAILGSIQIAGSGLPTGGVRIIAVVGALIMLWAVLCGPALLLLATMPNPYNTYLFLILTFLYSIGAILTYAVGT
jgi:hypothetical protein